MKQKWIALAVLGAMLVQVAPISSMTAAALETTAISDITATDAVLLKYNKHDTYVEITGFRADETDIVLPDTIDGLPVTTIQEGAFFSSQLTSIYIPESVTQIGGIAFQACADLQRIEVDEHNPAYTSVDGVLYDKEEKILYAYPNALAENENTLKSSYSVPDGVETIAQGVFFYNQSLTNLTLPHSIQVLEADAFSDTALRDIYYDGTQADWNAIAKGAYWWKCGTAVSGIYAEMHYLRENTSTETTAATTIQTTTESTEGTVKRLQKSLHLYQFLLQLQHRNSGLLRKAKPQPQ
ncbi:MAG: leucine-rich repeat domain-containing protein [Ruminococcus callidus]